MKGKKTHFELEHPGVDFGIFYLGGPKIYLVV